MTFDFSSYAAHDHFTTHPDNVYTHGALEPVLTLLDLRGFQLRDLVLIGMNEDCGTLLLPSEPRAETAAAALEPAYAATLTHLSHPQGEAWAVTYARRQDGTELSALITNLTFTDGTVITRTV
ncbi:hypothetical protein [Streptomyces sp. NPDC002540]